MRCCVDGLLFCCSGVRAGARAGVAEGADMELELEMELDLDWYWSWTGLGTVLTWSLWGVEVPVGWRSSPTVAAPHFHFTSVGGSVGCFI